MKIKIEKTVWHPIFKLQGTATKTVDIKLGDLCRLFFTGKLKRVGWKRYRVVRDLE